MNNYEFVKFKNQALELDVEVSPNDDTVWLTKEQMALLFDRDRSVISKHINNIYREGELDRDSTCAKNAHVQIEGKRSITRVIEFYNLDIIISIGYRVKSKNGVIFRKWATNILKEYLLKGYAVSHDRTLVTNENYINLINEVNNLKNDVKEIKSALSRNFPSTFICYEEQIYEGFTFINSLIRSARNKVIIIDGYADNSVLDFLTGIKKDIKKIILCHKTDRIEKPFLERFIKEYGPITIKEDKSYHDRFLIIDNDVYLLGASLNSLGNKTSTITKTNEYKIKDIYKDEWIWTKNKKN